MHQVEYFFVGFQTKIPHNGPWQTLSWLWDQGTTSTRACLVGKDGKLLAQDSHEFPQIFPKPGWVEHDPEAIWSSTLKAIEGVLKKSHVGGNQIAAIGITNQRETVVAWDRATGHPVMNAIVWQCRRTSDFCAKLEKEKRQTVIRSKTGLVIDPYFSGSKLRWILKKCRRGGEVRRFRKSARRHHRHFLALETDRRQGPRDGRQ